MEFRGGSDRTGEQQRLVRVGAFLPPPTLSFLVSQLCKDFSDKQQIERFSSEASVCSGLRSHQRWIPESVTGGNRRSGLEPPPGGGTPPARRLSVSVSSQPPLVPPLGEDVLEELVDGPADGGGGHLVDDPGLDAPEERRNAPHPVDGPEGLAQAGDVAAAGHGGPHGAARRLRLDHVDGLSLLRVEEGLADVQGGGGGGGHGACERARHHVRGGVVLSVGVEELLQVLVGHEVERLEGHVHGQLGGVAAVEGGGALAPQQGAHAVQHAAVRRVEHLQPLLHNCRGGASFSTKTREKQKNRTT